MKKYFLFISLSILLIACKKEDRSVNTLEIKEKFQQFTSIKSTSDQRNAYSTLTAQEKVDMWNLHLNEIKVKNNFTSAQLEVFNFAKKILIPENFVAQIGFLNSDEMIIWNHIASENFSKKEMFNYFASFNNVPIAEENQSTTELNSASANKCSCSTLSDYCNVFGGGTGGWWKCDDGATCTIVKSDCGAWWNYDCNNQCKYHTIFN